MKQLVIGKKAREDAVEALNEIAEFVGSTLGPAGLPVIYDSPSSHGGDSFPKTTKDGVTTISWMKFEEPIKHAVHYFAKQAANHSVLESGDGTSSTIVLASSLAKAITEENSSTPQAYARTVEKHINNCIQWIKDNAVAGKELASKVAYTSCNGDQEIVDCVMTAIDKTSRYGSILVEKNVGSKTRYEVQFQDGYNAGRGYNYHPTLAQSVSDKPTENAPFTMQHPYLFLYNGEINNIEQLNRTVVDLSQTIGNSYNLLVFAYDVDESVCNKLVEINRRYHPSNPDANGSNIKIFISKIKQTAEINSGLQILQDISAISGGKIYDGATYNSAKMIELGRVKSATVSMYKTVIHGRNENHTIPERAQQNLNAIENARSDLDKEVIRTRNAELTDGLVTIVVGAGHFAAVQERADRVDDAIKAAQAAIRGGVVPGSGITYIKAAEACNLPNNLKKALGSINNKVFENLGSHPKKEQYDIVNSSFENAFSIDSLGGINVGNFAELGICDAAETAMSVLKNATQLAILCSTTNGYSLTADLRKIEEYKNIKSMMSGN